MPEDETEDVLEKYTEPEDVRPEHAPILEGLRFGGESPLLRTPKELDVLASHDSHSVRAHSAASEGAPIKPEPYLTDPTTEKPLFDTSNMQQIGKTDQGKVVL
ncbi:hypothetical protein C8J57DRAFT_1521236 [Mycena rebaudengoi]|nr:hypothetical protein C8J57DRAFT_1521236 [Mycena rebaudengoi]